MKLREILKDSDYKLDLFSQEAIIKLEKRILSKDSKNGGSYYAPCLIRAKEVKLSPEEIVRQLYLDKLLNEYNYPKDKIQVEVAIQQGRDTGKTA